MGLLNKILTESAPSGDSKKKNLPASDADIIINGIGELAGGIDSPGRLFSFLAETIPITKGALLLPDPSQEIFSCWSSRGLDKTTERRLRVPVSLFDATRTIPARVESLDDWKPFFSKREEAFLEPFLLCPLPYGETLIGALLIFESPVLEGTQPPEGLQRVIDATGGFLYDAREAALSRLSVPAVSYCDKERLIEFCTGILEKGLHAILVSLDPLLYINSVKPGLDRYRLLEDIERILSSLVSENGMACKTGAGKVLMVLEASHRMDGSLLHNHILSALSSFLSGPPDSTSLSCSVTVCPDDEEDPAAAVGIYLSD